MRQDSPARFSIRARVATPGHFGANLSEMGVTCCDVTEALAEMHDEDRTRLNQHRLGMDRLRDRQARRLAQLPLNDPQRGGRAKMDPTPVLECLRLHGRALPVKFIAENTGLQPGQVYARLRLLCDSGKARKVAFGGYEATNSEETSAC